MAEQASGGGRMLSVSKASAVLGVSPKTLRKWTDQGLVKAARLPGRGDRCFPPAELVRVRREVLGLAD